MLKEKLRDRRSVDKAASDWHKFAFLLEIGSLLSKKSNSR